MVAAAAACGADRNPVAPTTPTEPGPPPPPPPPAPTWSVSGVVSSEEPSAPLAGARIEVTEGADAGKNVQTGEDGRYELTGLREGELALRVSAEGFEDQAKRLALTENQTANFSLRRPPAPPPPPPPTRTLTGTLIETLSAGAIAGANVTVDGLGVFTTGSDGTFTIDAPDPEQIRTVTFSSADTVTRTTQLRVPGPDTQVTVIPRSFDLRAFDQMFRSTGPLQRWVSAPRLIVQTRVLQFTNLTAQAYAATDAVIADEEIDLLLQDLNWGLPLLTDGRLQFAAQDRETAASSDTVQVARLNEIVVVRFAGLQDATGFWGYGRWASDGSGTIQGGIIMLDAAFDVSGSEFRRSLRVHELGHALGYNHVTSRESAMNSSARIEPNEFDLKAVRIGFLRPPGNRSPDTDPDAFTSNVKVGALIWKGDR